MIYLHYVYQMFVLLTFIYLCWYQCDQDLSFFKLWTH